MPDISRLQREYGRYNLTHTVTYRERTDVYNEESLDVNTTYEDFTIWVKVSPVETEARLGVTGGVVLREEFAISFIVRWDDRLKGLDQIVDRERTYNLSRVEPLVPRRWMQIHCVAAS